MTISGITQCEEYDVLINLSVKCFFLIKNFWHYFFSADKRCVKNRQPNTLNTDILASVKLIDTYQECFSENQ